MSQPTLTKAELADLLTDAEDLRFYKKEAKEFIDLVFETMRGILETGTELKVSCFGNFSLRNKKERPGRNPKTGEDIPIEPRRVVTFKAGKKLKDRIKQLPPQEQVG
jgi:integration host factor subunit alpha